MNSREIVSRTLNYEYPERVARSFEPSDLTSVRARVATYATEWREVGGSRWERRDEWGNTWGRVDPTSKGEVIKGVLDDLAQLSSYQFPNYARSQDYANVAQKRAEVPDKWLIGSLPGFTFNIARKMRKLEHYLMDLLTERERIRELHDQIDLVLADMIRNYAATGVDSVMFPEDWGTQTQTLISPKLWFEEFYPRFEKLCHLAHVSGVKVFMHSCGQIGAIVPGLIEAGIDLLQFDQPDLHGIDTLAAYQDQARITFWCPVDIQKTLQTRDETIIRHKAQEMLDKLWRGRGGFIAGYYTDNVSIGLEPKWQAIACEAFLEHGLRSSAVV
jgi:uroporphyrinogen decarboxylase